MRSLVFLPLLGLLVACATPQERCVAVAAKDLRVVRALIDETRQNIDRGYAIETETRTRPTLRVCTGTRRGNVGLGGCWGEQIFERERPVAIDLEAERRRLEDLERKERELNRRVSLAARQCQAQYAR